MSLATGSAEPVSCAAQAVGSFIINPCRLRFPQVPSNKPKIPHPKIYPLVLYIKSVGLRHGRRGTRAFWPPGAGDLGISSIEH